MKTARNITMKDIARELNVSVTTVSKVLNGHTDISERLRAKVLEKVDELGYVPNIMAKNLRLNKGNIVAIILSDISQPYYSSVIQGYEKALTRRGYNVMMFSSMEDKKMEERFLQQVASMNVAGIIIDPVQDSDPDQRLLKQLGAPYVLSNRYLREDQGYYVVADNERAGHVATQHLLERKPGAPVFCVNGPNHISPSVKRYDGYRRALREAGVEIRQEWVFENNFDLKDAYRAGEKIASFGLPQYSVFCTTDRLAVGVLRALRDQGVAVPQDVSVIGVDDIDTAAYLTPALSTIAIPREQIGEISAKMLMDLIEKKDLAVPRTLLDIELVVRETS